MFIRNESFKTFTRHYPVVSIILALNIVVYLIFFLDKFLSTGIGYTIVQFGIGYNLLIHLGEWWRLITPIFLHITFSHVLFNCFSLFLFAPALELILGKWKFIIAYLGTGLISNIATYFMQPLQFSHLGASGAIYGLFGFYLYMVALRRDLISRQDKTVITVILVLGLIMTFLTPNIDILGHLFGLLGGFILAPIMLFRVKGPHTY
ncbi:membrane associated rhomboid family serine protease [Scopulibacillus darangshiensis]|uniref:Membrane associated rhomboid family serine protease n=1 Tax=Scopulibacillus darangshiensis TaxID=442528 RepID=A0A4R2NPR4_9BACL|nr:rhomboid family intramembrane serine protease [Scopulibacillus darangshiensis]TCP23819.1 membrane associated rhomboid family serine protease [Scopulibacillus darangshiensis]